MPPSQVKRWVLAAAAVSICTQQMRTPACADVRPRAVVSKTADLKTRFAKLPMAFEGNHGQADSQVRYLAHGPGYALFLTGEEAVLDLPAAKGGEQRGLRMRLVGAKSDVAVTGKGELPGKSNYFIGNDPKRWHRDVPTYARVEYSQVYPGIDLAYYGNQDGQLEYDFIVAPGADPRAIRFDVASDATQGMPRAALRIAANGDLVVPTRGGEIRLRKPVVYQVNEREPESSGSAPASASGIARASDSAPSSGPARAERRILRHARFVLTASNQARFEIGRYDPAHALIIDPALAYSTYLGGSTGGAWATGIAVDASGSAYVTGYTWDTDFPTANPFQASNHYQATTRNPVGPNVFVTKFNPAGTALVYSTYLGGSVSDQGSGIAVDSAGNAYITGTTSSPDFPTTAGAFQASPQPNTENAFIAKLDPTGSALVFSTYLGGPPATQGNAIAIDSSGNSYVTGVANDAGIPMVNAFQTYSNTWQIEPSFVAKLNATGSALVYSTYLSGTNGAAANAIAVDGNGNAYVTGYTYSTDFPTLNPFQSSNNQSTQFGAAPGTVFLTKFDAGGALSYSTYLGGSGGDDAYAIAVDALGEAYVAGYTASKDFPVMNAYQATSPAPLGQNRLATSGAAFVTKFNAAGSALEYSTYLGGPGSGPETVRGIAVDATGDAFVTGSTSASDFPTQNAFQATDPGGEQAFVTEFDPAGSALVFSSFLGGSYPAGGSGNVGNAIAVDGAGDAYITGYTRATDFPTCGPFQTTNTEGYGNFIAFVTKVSATGCAGASPAPTVTLSATPTSITQGSSSTLTWVSTNATACTASGAWSGAESVNGSQAVTPTAAGSFTYTLTCTGAGGSANASTTVTVTAPVTPAPTVTLAVNPTSITPGSSATLTWSSTNATACTASGAWSGAESVSGSQVVTPTAAGSDTYTLICTGAGGSANASATLTVTAPVTPAPTVTLSVSPTSIISGQSAMLTWSTTNASSCTASGSWSGNETTSGSLAVTPSAVGNASYTLSCTGAGGSAASTAVLTVNPVTTVTISGKAGGGGIGLDTLLALALLFVVRLRRELRLVMRPRVVLRPAMWLRRDLRPAMWLRRLLRLEPVAARLSPMPCPGPLAALALLIVFAQASAQETTAPLQFDWEHAYLGIRAGEADYTDSTARLDADLASAGEPGTRTLVTQHQAGGVLYAGVPFHRSLSLEVGFADLGEYPVQITTTSPNIPQLAQTIASKLWPAGRGFTAGLAAPIDVSSWFAIEPRLALLAYQSKQQVYTPDGTLSVERKGLGADAGFALLLRPTRQLSFGAGLDCFEIAGRCSVLLYSAEVEFSFGR